MAASAARQFFRQATLSKAVIQSVKCSRNSSSTSGLLLNLAKGKTSTSLQSRCLSQLLPTLHIQAANNLNVASSNVSSILDKCFVSKSPALTIAINESEVTSTDESDEDEEATLYILTEMFTILCVGGNDG